MTAHAWRKSAGTLTSSCGTKNDTIMNSPIAPVMNSGTSRFTPRLLLRGEPLGQRVDAERLERAADDDDREDHQLDHVRTLEAAHELRLPGQIRARGEQLLADQRVVARHDEERQLVDV